MAAQAHVNGGDALAAGRARQRLKLAALGYVNARSGVDADEKLLSAALAHLCRLAIAFVEALPGDVLKGRRPDVHRQGSSDTLRVAAISYAHARHGIDADVGMAREGLAMLCQAAIDYVESLPKEEPAKRPASAPLRLGNGARS